MEPAAIRWDCPSFAVTVKIDTGRQQYVVDIGSVLPEIGYIID
ncbi:hypothetical protein HDF16_005458 [Granulicella aggregans]|uniref:Uncharacterized protein n=1 Tax=Granulicella aggregans TaxID=474949 RepID=A0A7W8E6I8_9BACT|nr:hypothetical protein [Granulicella aggregans]